MVQKRASEEGCGYNTTDSNKLYVRNGRVGPANTEQNTFRAATRFSRITDFKYFLVSVSD